jgi:hypothetical protein
MGPGVRSLWEKGRAALPPRALGPGPIPVYRGFAALDSRAIGLLLRIDLR